jgi:hypothetical protein
MSFFLQVNFQYGEFFVEGNSLLIDIIVSAIGAFIGIFGAILLYRHQIRKEQNDTLRYVSVLLISVINFTKRQSDYCTKLSADIKAKPTELNLLHFEANQDLKRIVERLDQEKFYHAYLAKYSRKKEMYKTFQGIYSCLDFITMTLDQIRDYLEKELISITAKKNKYLELLDIGETKAALLTVNPKFQQEKLLMDFLNERLVNYLPQKADATTKDLAFPINEFIYPVIRFLTHNYPTIPECNDISLSLKQSISIYNLIEPQSKVLAKSFDEYSEQLKNSGNKLLRLSIKIINDFET